MFTILRLLAFAVPLAALLLLGIEPMWAAVAAAALGFAISLVFLRTPRERVAGSLYEARHPVHGEDEDVEDDYLDDEDALLDQDEDETPAAAAQSAEKAVEKAAEESQPASTEETPADDAVPATVPAADTAPGK